MKKVLEIGVLLSAERDLDKLLERILTCVMELACCDGGALYLRDGDELRFKIMQNVSMKTYTRDPDIPHVPLRRENACALALLEKRTVAIEDVYSCEEYDFSGHVRYDVINNYRTGSMLAVPMVNREGEGIGVIQLINALDENGKTCPFSPEVSLVLESVASQAAITIQNVRYIAQINELLRSFVRVLSTAIDKRTPYNVSHTRHMAKYGERFLDHLNTTAAPGDIVFDDLRREELLMSIWLHDIGKLATPLKVMNKASRLLPEQRTDIVHRMEVIRLRGEIDLLSGRMTEDEYKALTDELRRAEALVERADTADIQENETLSLLDDLAARTYVGDDGESHPWLTEEEHRMLSIRGGTLSAEERRIMENHVVLTDELLSQIRFPAELSHVREWAAGHHEMLNGQGYPRHLSGNDIPLEVRIITILDIFDALVASDRPYKKGKPVPLALNILRSMAKEGRLDVELTEKFIESRCWEDNNGSGV